MDVKALLLSALLVITIVSLGSYVYTEATGYFVFPKRCITDIMDPTNSETIALGCSHLFKGSLECTEMCTQILATKGYDFYVGDQFTYKPWCPVTMGCIPTKSPVFVTGDLALKACINDYNEWGDNRFSQSDVCANLISRLSEILSSDNPTCARMIDEAGCVHVPISKKDKIEKYTNVLTGFVANIPVLEKQKVESQQSPILSRVLLPDPPKKTFPILKTPAKDIINSKPITVEGKVTGSYCSKQKGPRGSEVLTHEQDPLVKGTVYLKTVGHSEETYTDKCTGTELFFGTTSKVLEYYCRHDGKGNFWVESYAHDCPDGTVCSNGACIKGTMCKEEDVNNQNVKGRTISIGEAGGTRVKFDKCLNKNTLKEYYCNGFNMESRIVSCQCSNGACSPSCLNKISPSDIPQVCRKLFAGANKCINKCASVLNDGDYEVGVGYKRPDDWYCGVPLVGSVACSAGTPYTIHATGTEALRSCIDTNYHPWGNRFPDICTMLYTFFKSKLRQQDQSCAGMVDQTGCVFVPQSYDELGQERGTEPPERG